MNTYRVLMQDTHNGQQFNFAVFVEDIMPHYARIRAEHEFRLEGAIVIEVKEGV